MDTIHSRVLPDFLTMYRQLIAIPTISATEPHLDHSNLPLIQQLAEWCQSLGCQVDLQPVPHTRNKYNLLAKLGAGEGGLLLSGHTDTVPFDDGRWSVDPFKLHEHANKLYGLGTADMKGFFAFILHAAQQFDVKQLKKPLYILATADEETSMAGARHFALDNPLRPDCAIIGEPTSLQPIRAHKGSLANLIRITGKTGHSSDPDKGINAIELMHEAISYLLALKASLKQRYHNDAFSVPYPTMNLGHIHGGDAVNRICACCELSVEIRPLPGLALTDLEALISQALSPLQQRYPDRLQITALHDGIPGYECSVDHPLVKELEQLTTQPIGAVNYGTEAPFLQQLCPTFVLGPGSINQAHQPDEYIDTAFIKPTHQLVSQLIHRFCG